MDLLIGVALLCWSVGLLIFKQFFSDGLTSQAMIQIAVAAVGALVILGPKAVNWAMNFEIPETKPENEKKIDKHKKRLDAAQVKEFQDDYYDFIALNYLKDRAKKIESEEAFDLVVKLNTLIFSGELDEK